MNKNYPNKVNPQSLSQNNSDLLSLKQEIVEKAKQLGFQQVGVTHTELGEHIQHYKRWLDQGFHADLDYMSKHGSKRWRPSELEPGTLRVISLRMDYMDLSDNPELTLNDTSKAYISRYTLGRDYHKLIRKRLSKLITHIKTLASERQYRAFVDSAPVLERAFAQQAGLGWFGKNTMIINRTAGSWFFLGEIYTDLALPIDPSYEKTHCGNCTACLDLCPTNAFVEPYVLNTERCISYLTIEHKGSIPEELRPLMGNRIFGCDDCQLVCPWNRFAQQSQQGDFKPRHNLDNIRLIELFQWSEEEFLSKTEGSAIRRAGYECWQRNLAVALGNAPYSFDILQALKQRALHTTPLVLEHIEWAIERQASKADSGPTSS